MQLLELEAHCIVFSANTCYSNIASAHVVVEIMGKGQI